MATSGNTVALFSISSSALIAIFGIVVPFWIHASDQSRAKRIRIAEKRELIYTQLVQLMGMVRTHQTEKSKQLAEEMNGLLTIWCSEEVRRLFFEWMDIFPTSLGPDKNSEQDAKVFRASEALRVQLTQEMQDM